MGWIISCSPLSTLLVTWFCLSLAQSPLSTCSSTVDSFRVEHSYGTFQNRGGRISPTALVPRQSHMPEPLGIMELLLQRRNRMPVRSRSTIAPQFGRIKGRKMLFGSEGCAAQDLALTQGAVSTTSGIPTFSVQIINLCGDCAMGEIRVACGAWASATPVDPFVFTRIAYNDCLVNNGEPLESQGTITFQYANSAMYPMSIVSATNDCKKA